MRLSKKEIKTKDIQILNKTIHVCTKIASIIGFVPYDLSKEIAFEKKERGAKLAVCCVLCRPISLIKAISSFYIYSDHSFNSSQSSFQFRLRSRTVI